MRCLFSHSWTYDLRHFHVYRKCEACGAMQRHIWSENSVYTVWESVRERTYIELEQRQILQKRDPTLVRLAHALGLLRTRAGDRTRTLARST
jgi:hypothetical protein